MLRDVLHAYRVASDEELRAEYVALGELSLAGSPRCTQSGPPCSAHRSENRPSEADYRPCHRIRIRPSRVDSSVLDVLG